MEMKRKVIDFLRASIPFLVTLFLWRASVAWLNPGGLLALAAIFFSTFIRPVRWFVPFGVLMCFLIDYQSDTLLYWTSVYCTCYAANGFQHAVDLTRSENDGAGAFAIFFATAAIIISIPHIVNFTNAARLIWTIIWECAMYFPIVMLIKKAGHD